MEIRVLRYFLEAAREESVTHAAEFKALDEITGGDIHIGCAESDGIKHTSLRHLAICIDPVSSTG